MRLFVAILFSDSVTEQLFRGLVSLRQQSIQGNFTRRENLHLTLAFLGETHQTEGAKRAIDAIVSPAFSLSINRLGRFQRPGGDIMWVGIPGNPHLSALHQQLSSALREEGFSLEKMGNPIFAHPDVCNQSKPDEIGTYSGKVNLYGAPSSAIILIDFDFMFQGGFLCPAFKPK